MKIDAFDWIIGSRVNLDGHMFVSVESYELKHVINLEYHGVDSKLKNLSYRAKTHDYQTFII